MFKIFKNFNKKDYLVLLIAISFIALQVGLELKMPDYMSEITRLVQSEGGSMNEILRNGGLMLACAFGALVATIITNFFISELSASFSARLRKKLFDKVEDLDKDTVKELSTSSLITRCTNDITQIQTFISMGAQLLVRSPMTAIWAITKILNKSWQWGTATAIAVVLVISVVATLMALVMPRFKIVQKLLDRINKVTRENLNGIRVVRAFNAEKYQEDKFNDVNSELTRLRLLNQGTMSFLYPTISLVMNGLGLSIFAIGAILISQAGALDKITLFSDMVVFSSYAMQVIMSFLFLSMIFMLLPRAQVSAERINEVLDKKSMITDGERKQGLEGHEGQVEFRNVSFKYPDAEEYLLKDISFSAKKGQTIAFIGSTGSGKSSLINLVPRFYDVSEGEILVDGVNVKDYELRALHDKIGYVPQRAVLFNGSVSSNIRFGENGKKELSADEVKDAIAIAQGKDFVEKMAHQYDAHIAQGGSNVSGGQKQRLAIARAVARKPEIFIFDDSFSALDYKTDAALRQALKKSCGDATSLVVAQRIGTIMHADQILVLDDGRCVGQGTHKELLKSCKVYREIALSQLSEEELNA